MLVQDLSRFLDRWEAVLAAPHSRITLAIVFWHHPAGLDDVVYDGRGHGS